MSMNTDIKELFRRAFGYEAPDNSYVIEQAPARKETGNLGGHYYAVDMYGREFFMPVTLAEILLPFAVISINCKKTIVATPMPERQGSVHEQISVDDYVINIKGLLVSEDNAYPEDSIIELQKLFLRNEAVTMRSVLSDIFLNGKFEHRVIIKSLSFPAVSGTENVKPYEMELESDMIFDLEIK